MWLLPLAYCVDEELSCYVMPNISIIGASSFIGGHLLKHLSRQSVRIKILLRNTQPNFDQASEAQLQFFKGDLQQADSLARLIEPDDTVINLAYLALGTKAENLEAMENLARVCADKKIKRLIHCSTAVVAGSTLADQIQETTPCLPCTNYQVTKFAIEQLLLSYQSQYEVVILRPTAVFGPEGKNLLKLAQDLLYGPRLKNYLKSCVLGKRRMNLVYVGNVVAAIIFLLEKENLGNERVFLISEDENNQNNYTDIEFFLRTKFHQPHYFPRIRIPGFFFQLICYLLGKNKINPRQIFLMKNLSKIGFKNLYTFEDGLTLFVKWYLSTQRSNENFKC